ncbi:MAG: AmmeMemoRadiSam system radical SAM enzyme [Actinobacteria bacterium]|nr:AmmeMemoRadiSam system radical SAM enzyme [Actinomycetota bacterium]
MKEALLYEKLEENKVKCFVCPRYCVIKDERLGYCGVRLNKEGALYTLIYNLCSSVAVDPIEKKPVFHYHPGSLVLSLGTVGCNLRCIHCQNWQIAHVRFKDKSSDLTALTPSQTVKMAKEYKCEGVAWTYNEPTIWLEYTLDSAKLCKENNLYTVYVTNGYITSEALDLIGPYLDVYRVDVKGFTNEFYKKLANVKDFSPILKAAAYAKEKWKAHVEIVTNIIPTMNDDEAQLRGIARWIKESLGSETPWHVTRFMPYLKLSHLEPTPVKTLEFAQKIGYEEGLRFIYVGNIPGHEGENTYCYNCRNLIIKRIGYSLKKIELNKEGKCNFCGADLNFKL